MFTLFDLFRWAAALGLMAYLAIVGQAQFGFLGAIGGGVLGFVGGNILGCMPLLVYRVSYRRHLKRSSTEQLKSELDEQYFVSHLLISELVVRGEPVEQFWPYVLSQVQSESSDQRSFGWHNLNIWFPRMANQVEDYDPHASTDACREKLKMIEKAEPDAAPLPPEDVSSGRR